jgi:aminoglycoside 2'-N-acetyltransferase I
LTAAELAAIRRLLDDAWADDPEPFDDDDWHHSIGGVHVVLEEDGAIVSHASVVARELETSGHRLPTGYVEAVATARAYRRRGRGSAVMRAVGEHVDRTFRLGALGTGLIAFYERLGWVAWRGPTFVRTASGPARTPEEDGYVLVRLTPSSPPLDLAAPISCDWRPGDAW